MLNRSLLFPTDSFSRLHLSAGFDGVDSRDFGLEVLSIGTITATEMSVLGAPDDHIPMQAILRLETAFVRIESE